MDTSDHQFGAVNIQEGKPIPFYSHKLTKMQNIYTVMEKEFLCIVETVKKFGTILCG